MIRCIFCGQEDGPWSIEHVIPAGLGYHADLVLPYGASCRSCNNRLGRQVDEALVHLFEVKFIRGLHRVPDRSGRLVREIDIHNGTMTFPVEGGIEIKVRRDGDLRRRGKNLQVAVVHNRTKSGDQMRRATRLS
jgi:hypothetical protein